MIYSSVEFCLFFAAVLPGYLLLRGRPARLILLLAASLAFYAWTGFFDLFVFLLVVGASYAAAAAASRWPRRRGLWIFLGVTALAAHLIFWKYGPWLVDAAQAVFPGLHGGRPLHLHLPVGVSFFTLTGIAFLVDFYRGEARMMGFGEYLLFHSFFSHLIAGPIVRARQLLPQIRRLETPSTIDLAAGLSLFARGFFKKLIIADRLGPFVGVVFASPEKFDRHALAWAMIGAFVQVWGDFSGYTDMGRGTARMLGIRLPENFLSPLLCRKPSEFTQRWHVTLNLWLRDYIWSPMSRSPLSVLFTMLLVGLWHGASWNFLLWGFYLRVLVIAERCIERSPAGAVWEAWVPDPVRRLLLIPVTLTVTLAGLVLFRSSGLSDSLVFFHALICGPAGDFPGAFRTVFSPTIFWTHVYPSCAFGLLLEAVFYRDAQGAEGLLLRRGRRCVEFFKSKGFLGSPVAGGLAGALLGALAALCVAAAVAFRQHDNLVPFIYFQF